MIHTDLYSMIYKRKSFHIFRNCEQIEENELEEIQKKFETFTPLYPDIRVAMRITTGEETTCRRGQEYCILLFLILPPQRE